MLRMDQAVLAARVQRVTELLRAHGLSALVLYAGGSVLGSQSPAHAYLRFLCDFDGVNTSSMLVLRPGHAPTLLTANKRYMRAHVSEKALWFDDVRHLTVGEFGAAVCGLLSADGPAVTKVAYIGYPETPAPVWEALKGLAAVQWDHAFAAKIDGLRVQKGEVEIGFHRHAASICDSAFGALAGAVNSGRPGYQLKALMEYTARDAACDYCDTWLTAAPQADFFRYRNDETTRVPQAGDQLLAGIMLTFDGHWGHSVRTASVGAPTQAHKDLYEICREMYEAGLDKVRPGADLCEVNDAMNTVLHRHYQDHEVRRTRAGHGLGYAYEDPIATAAFPNAWEKSLGADRPVVETLPGMLLELHPHLFVPGVGGAMIGDMVLVTESSSEVLTTFPREMARW